jgi:DNA-binding NarL/FixJ family response regulator
MMLKRNRSERIIQIIKQKINSKRLYNKLHLVILVRYIFQSKPNFMPSHTHTNFEKTLADFKALEQDLTFREQEVLQAVKQATSCKEIADELFISVETVKSHRKNIISKLGLSGKVAFRKYVIKTIAFHP